jgi:hypothetical protein
MHRALAGTGDGWRRWLVAALAAALAAALFAGAAIGGAATAAAAAPADVAGADVAGPDVAGALVGGMPTSGTAAGSAAATAGTAVGTRTTGGPTGRSAHGVLGRPLPVQVALVGVPGLEWSDLDAARTPHLWRLVGEGGAASLSTRAVPPPDRGTTCPAAGWLTVSAGQRAGAPGTSCTTLPAPEPTADGGAVIPGWAELAGFNAATPYRAAIGTLGRLAAEGGKVAAVGPGAALAAADGSGRVGAYAADLAALGDLADHNLIVLDAGDLATVWLDQGERAPAPEARQAAVAAADRRVGELLARLPATTTVLVAGVSDASTAAHLHVAIARGPAPNGEPYPPGHLTSAATRQDALVTITDLTATVIRLLGLDPPPGVVGRVWEAGGQAPTSSLAQVPADGSTGEPTGEGGIGDGASPGDGRGSPGDAAADRSAAIAETVAGLADADLASQVLREVRGPFFSILVAVQLLFYLLAAAAFRRGFGGARLLRTVQVVAVGGGAVGVSTFLAQLVPWWSTDRPMAALIVTILGCAALITAAAFAGPWRSQVLGPLTVVAGVSSVALLLDVATGSHLQVNAVSGYEPVTGGRFYGFSNIAFAVFATGTILFLAGIAQPLMERGRRRTALVACAAYGLLAVFADGWPGWGADFGGVPAFVLGLAVLLLLLSGRRASPLRLTLVAAAGVALIAAISFADWSRPAERRTHLGIFFQQVLDGEAGAVVWRKFTAMVGVTVGNWSLTLLSLAALAFLFLVLGRPSRWGAAALDRAYAAAPALRAGLLGALACALAGFLMNDSGIAIPAMALTVAVPLTLAAAVRALGPTTPTPPAPPSAPAASREPHAAGPS